MAGQTQVPLSSVTTPQIPQPVATAIRNGLVPRHATTPTSSPNFVKPLETTRVQSLKTKFPSHPPSTLEHELMKDEGTRSNELVDSEEVRMKVITIAGENEWPTMKLSHFPKSHYPAGNPQSLHKGFSITGGGDGVQLSTDRSDLEIYKDIPQKAKAMQSTTVTAFINNNVQAVTNAIVCDGTFTHHDPGVQLSLTRNGTGGNDKKCY